MAQISAQDAASATPARRSAGSEPSSSASTQFLHAVSQHCSSEVSSGRHDAPTGADGRSTIVVEKISSSDIVLTPAPVRSPDRARAWSCASDP